MRRTDRRAARALALALPLFLVACVVDSQTLGSYGAGSDRLELQSTAFFPSEERFSAAATLATLLYSDGVTTVNPAAVAPKLGPASDAVALQSAFRSAALSFERLPYVLDPKLGSVISELRAGRPVGVLLNLAATTTATTASATSPMWRYAVVVGYEPSSDSLLLRSGTQGRVRMTPAAFAMAWKDGGNWAVVLTRADLTPSTATLQRWIASSEGFTVAEKPELAEAAAEAALKRWPEQPLLATVALGNARYARKDWSGSQSAYVKALSIDDNNPVVHNNLALVLLERRCVDLAEHEVALAIAHETDPKLREAYAGTDAKIKRYAGTAIFCPPPTADAQAPIEYDLAPLNPDSPRAPRAPRKPRPK